MNETSNELVNAVHAPHVPQTAAGEVALYCYKIVFWGIVSFTIIQVSKNKKGA